MTTETQAPETSSANPVSTRPAAERRINVTPKAVEKIKVAFAREGVSGGGLRLGVLGGGCSGLSYQFKYDAKPRTRDHVFEFGEEATGKVQVFIDPKSMLNLDGLTLDYKESLMYSGFSFENPHAAKSCGCGTSFTAA